MNCDSGPGAQPDPTYGPALAAARAAGVEVLGYVDTDNGRRPHSLVLDDIARYREWYGTTGYLLDRAHVPCEVVRSYYAPLHFQLKSRDADTTIVVNPGTAVPSCFLDVADVLVDFEGPGETYLAASLPEWHVEHEPTRFWHIVYDVAPTQLDAVLATASRSGTGWLFVTDQPLDGGAPGRYLYDRLPHPVLSDQLRDALRLS